jgi:hypothetical protein
MTGPAGRCPPARSTCSLCPPPGRLPHRPKHFCPRRLQRRNRPTCSGAHQAPPGGRADTPAVCGLRLEKSHGQAASWAAATRRRFALFLLPAHLSPFLLPNPLAAGPVHAAGRLRRGATPVPTAGALPGREAPVQGPSGVGLRSMGPRQIGGFAFPAAVVGTEAGLTRKPFMPGRSTMSLEQLPFATRRRRCEKSPKSLILSLSRWAL